MIKSTLLILSLFSIFLYSCGSCGSDPVDSTGTEEDSGYELSGTISSESLDSNEAISYAISNEANPYLDVDYLKESGYNIPEDIISRSDNINESDLVLRSDISDALPDPLPVEMLALKVSAVDVSDYLSESFFKFSDDESENYIITRAGKEFKFNLKESQFELRFSVLQEEDDDKSSREEISIGKLNFNTGDTKTTYFSMPKSAYNLGSLSIDNDGDLTSENNILEESEESEITTTTEWYVKEDDSPLFWVPFTDTVNDNGSSITFENEINLHVADESKISGFKPSSIIGMAAYTDGTGYIGHNTGSIGLDSISNLTIFAWIKFSGFMNADGIEGDEGVIFESTATEDEITGEKTNLKLSISELENDYKVRLRITFNDAFSEAFNQSGGQAFDIISDDSVELNTLYFIAATARADSLVENLTFTISINGSLAKSSQFTKNSSIDEYTINLGNDYFKIGQREAEENESVNAFVGVFDEIAIFKKALSSEEISDYYERGLIELGF